MLRQGLTVNADYGVIIFKGLGYDNLQVIRKHQPYIQAQHR